MRLDPTMDKLLQEADDLLTDMVEQSESRFGKADEDDVLRYADAVLQVVRERYGQTLRYDSEQGFGY